jgi:hypothetical protein
MLEFSPGSFQILLISNFSEKFAKENEENKNQK